MNDAAAVIAHHEAGHAVAALMTAAGDLDGTVTVALLGGRGTGNANVASGVSGEPVQAAFIFYAGPWSEARARRWVKAPPEGLGDIADDGSSFRGMVLAAFKAANNNGRSDFAMYNEQVSIDPSIPRTEPYWSRELERAWPAIQQLAKALREGLIHAEPKSHPYADLPANRERVMKQFAMPSREVRAMVQPILEERGLWRHIS